MAQVLGRRIAEEDLVIKFNSFVRDWDEVPLLSDSHEALQVNRTDFLSFERALV